MQWIRIRKLELLKSPIQFSLNVVPKRKNLKALSDRSYQTSVGLTRNPKLFIRSTAGCHDLYIPVLSIDKCTVQMKNECTKIQFTIRDEPQLVVHSFFLLTD